MDPFRPLKSEDVDFTTKMLHKIQKNFVDLVKERRPKLDVNHKTVFTGDIFTGQEAVSIGLADGLCSDLKIFCIKKFGTNVKFQRCDTSKGFLSALLGFGPKARIELSVNDLLDELSDQQQAKFGL